ncbi:transcription elongation factor TFIIS-like [Populus alba x Populus x berolinensis]|nr:transcription elongation factor TFIIS-like [Populus alba x Populus x berolinensis]
MERELVELFDKAKKAADASLNDDTSSSGPEVFSVLGKNFDPLQSILRIKIKAVASDLLETWKKIVIDETMRKQNGSIDNNSSVTAEDKDCQGCEDMPGGNPDFKCEETITSTYRSTKAEDTEALSKVASEADEDIRDEVEACDPIRVAVSDQKNPDLRRKVLLGQVQPQRLVTMPPEEMASEQRKRENNQIKEKALFDCERGGQAEATTDQFKCGRCGQRKCTYYQMQTRSADEPMTTYVTCVNCNNHWKFC